MKVLIAIPSKNRAKRIMDLTLSWLQESSYEWVVFVEPQDCEEYQKVIPSAHLWKLTANNMGLGFCKEEIKKYAVRFGFDVIFKCDDDMQGWYGRERNRRDAVQQDVLNYVIQDALEAFGRSADIQAISFPYAWQMFDKGKWTGINQRLQSCYIVRTSAFHADRRISMFEDMANFLYIRVANGIVLRYGDAGLDVEDVGTNKGGCQDFDRKVESEKELAELRKIYPALKFKRVVGKKWNIEPDFNDKFLRGGTQF